MSIAERYSRATRSSDLKLEVDPKDIDVLIAAGMVKESLATRLIRLRSEFDGISRGPYSRTLVSGLQSFPVCRVELVRFCIERGSTLDGKAIDVIAVRVLDLFLDPNCPACTGRMFSGGYGLPNIRCAPCGETGKRRHLWKHDAEENYARWMQSAMESMVDRASASMQRLLKQA